MEAGDKCLRYEHKSDLIHCKTGNGLRHASGPVGSNLPPVAYMAVHMRGGEIRVACPPPVLKQIKFLSGFEYPVYIFCKGRRY